MRIWDRKSADCLRTAAKSVNEDLAEPRMLCPLDATPTFPNSGRNLEKWTPVACGHAQHALKGGVMCEKNDSVLVGIVAVRPTSAWRSTLSLADTKQSVSVAQEHLRSPKTPSWNALLLVFLFLSESSSSSFSIFLFLGAAVSAKQFE